MMVVGENRRIDTKQDQSLLKLLVTSLVLAKEEACRGFQVALDATICNDGEGCG